MAIHKIEDNDSYVSEYYEEPAAAASGNSGEGRKTWLAIPFCRYMVRFQRSQPINVTSNLVQT